MSKSFEIQGVIHSIGETTEFGNNGFTKREYVVKVTGGEENSNYPNYAALELTRDNCALMDLFNIGDEVNSHFNLSGRLWSPAGKPEKCFTSLQAWKLDRVGDSDAEVSGHLQAPPPGGAADYGQLPSSDANDDELPF
ncbi:MAG: hypothetical protein COA42_09900 [Alteromonadaceae bacterium]|nr:MAG: hypothetical protein COA42_09900 [Alteromonadaceae bacterium]